jgi:hypothetical protein
LAARQAHNLEVAGSSPAPATKPKSAEEADFVYNKRAPEEAQMKAAEESDVPPDEKLEVEIALLRVEQTMPRMRRDVYIALMG